MGFIILHTMPDRSSNPKKRRRPNKELFLIQKKILILIFKENKELHNKNQIFNKLVNIGKEEKQTGLDYKQNILDSIDALEEIGLIKLKRRRGTKRNSYFNARG